MNLVLNVKKNSYPSYVHFIEGLVALGYARVQMVLEPGEFAVRGSIIDVFPTHHAQPLRVEYDNEKIDRLNAFHVHTQRSLSAIYETEIGPVDRDHQVFFSDMSDTTASDALLSDIEEGDYVVHESYGIGQFKGLVRLKLTKVEGEYLFIQYKGEDKVYVPLDQLHLIYKYSAGEAVPKVNGLYDGVWKKTTAKVKKDLEVLAEDVYVMQKTRQEKEGFAFLEDTVWQIDLERQFEHKDTPDQEKVTLEVKQDMESPQSMDRLLCGDVGYGKTEILVRAAFKAVENQKQVAILVPTTLLAQQHYRTFVKRFSSFPYRVEVLSRFKSAKEQKKILEELQQNKIQVIIGTHRLVQKDVHFHDFGLLIVDEEQRFGVTHKEKLKNNQPHVDVLSVSATPIPRTLYMALTGARSFSTLSTPPVARKPIWTRVSAYSDETVKLAIEHEIKSGGQVYYIYNHVQTMAKKYHHLKELMPTVRFGMAHGQMDEKILEKTMMDFLDQKFDVLLCSTIIENGLDMPNANTIILEKAEYFGLSQIHQLRGRVGRTEKQGYAFLLYTDVETLSEKSARRLQAIKEYAALGSGYKLALKDLEIRGAGTLLGKRQSGHITTIGFELYCKMLSSTMAPSHAKKHAPKPMMLMNPEKASYIPEAYIENPRERLALYQRLGQCQFQVDLEVIKFELEDRYGQLPLLLAQLMVFLMSQLRD